MCRTCPTAVPALIRSLADDERPVSVPSGVVTLLIRSVASTAVDAGSSIRWDDSITCAFCGDGSRLRVVPEPAGNGRWLVSPASRIQLFRALTPVVALNGAGVGKQGH